MAEKEESGFRQSYRYRMYPTDEQKAAMEVTFGCCRYVYNHYLRARIDAYERTREALRRPKAVPGTEDDERPEWVRGEDGKVVFEEVVNENYDPTAKPMSFFDTSKDLTRLKRELVDEDGHAWLKDADSVALVYALRNLDAAYQNFFRDVKKGNHDQSFPKFKKKDGSRRRYKTTVKAVEEVDELTGEVKVTGFALPKVGPVKVKVHRQPEGELVAASVSREPSGRYYLVVNVKGVEKEPLPPSGKEVGLTYGISRWVSGSDGLAADLPDNLERLEKRKVKAQRKLSRKQKGSKNYRKQQARLARAEERIADARAAATNELTRRIVDKYGTIAAREMGSKEMQQHQGRTTRDLPKKVQRRMNKESLSGNWFEVNRQLAYKAEWAGRTFVAVPMDTPTAQVCKDCGHIEEELLSDLRQEWTCTECGAVHSRKHNGAVNVLEAGKDILTEQEKSFVSKARKAKKDKKAKGQKLSA